MRTQLKLIPEKSKRRTLALSGAQLSVFCWVAVEVVEMRLRVNDYKHSYSYYPHHGEPLSLWPSSPTVVVRSRGTTTEPVNQPVFRVIGSQRGTTSRLPDSGRDLAPVLLMREFC